MEQREAALFGGGRVARRATRRFYTDLLMLGDDAPQVNFFSLQMVVDYYAKDQRSANDRAEKRYPKISPSETM